jgi:xanthine dehydrogenase accessory factor
MAAAPSAALPSAAGKAALDACLKALDGGSTGTLAVVLEVEGHGYSAPGTLVHVDAHGRRCGWISPGCLEASIESAAADCLAEGEAALLRLDNRDLSDVFSGGAGCRGRLTILLLPLPRLPGIQPLLAAFRSAHAPLQLSVQIGADADCRLQLRVADLDARWTLPIRVDDQSERPCVWQLRLAPLPRVLICGGGPESSLLLPLLAAAGWRIDLVESRPAWSPLAALAEAHLPALPQAEAGTVYDAVLVMAHHFDYDRSALLALASWPRLPWVGLLGPRQRRSDLLATLPAAARAQLDGRLESPAGLDLGGRGPAAIALSLAARLQQLATART